MPDDLRKDDDFTTGMAQSDEALNLAFVRKVLGIVAGQFVLTFAFAVGSAYFPTFG